MSLTINRAALSQGNREWWDNWSGLKARKLDIERKLDVFIDPHSITNQQLRIELIKTEQVMIAHRDLAYRLAQRDITGYFELWQAAGADAPPNRLAEPIGDFIYSNQLNAEPIANAQTSTGQARLIQKEMQQDFLAFTQRVNEEWSDTGKVAQKLIVDTGRKGSEMAIDFVFGRVGMPSPSMLMRSRPGVPSFGRNKDFVVDNLYDEMMWKPLNGSPGERFMREWNKLWFTPPTPQAAPSFLGPNSSLTSDSLSYALIDAAGAWVKLADGSPNATPEALAANARLLADIKAALAPYDLATAQVIAGDNGVAIELSGNRRVALDRSGSWAVSSMIEQSDGSGLVITTLNNGSRHEVRVGNDLTIQEAWYNGSGAQTYGLSYQIGGLDTGATLLAGDTSFRLATRADGSLDFGALSGLLDTPSNPTIFDLAANPFSLNPADSSLIGSSTGGWGLLGNGAGYTFSMTAPFVNENGGRNVAAGFMTTDGFRPGNHSLSEFGQLINGLRAGQFNGGIAFDDPLLSASLALQFVSVYRGAPYIDPVALDAHDDGIRLSAPLISFDLDANGQPETVPWTASTDPLLVMDLDGNGRIDSGRELVDLTDAQAPVNLLSLDDNGDKRLDGDDAAYWSLELWADRNQDGYASAEERQSLADAGIESIDLDPAHILIGTVAGQSEVKGVVATYADGSERTLWDVPLAAAAAKPGTATAYATGIDKVTSSGQVALLAKSALGVALDLNGSGADQGIGGLGDDTLIGTAGDDWLIGGAGADHLQGGGGRDLLVIDADDQQGDIDGGADIDTLLVADDRGVLLNLAQANVEVVYGGYGNDVFIGGGADNYFISGAAGDDLIVGGSADDALSGENGDDVVQGDAGDDLIRGHRGRDQLFGGSGNDVLDGGLDDDVIQGGGGNDVIVASGGRDTVDGGEGYDLIELQGGLEDYRFVQNADGGWTITDTRNADGSMVAEGLVSDRDGVQLTRNVERFSYMRGSAWTTYDFAYSNPLPADDRIEVAATSSSHAFSAASVLANDVDFQKQALSLYWVGDAIGGTVALSADKKTITFTPNPDYIGPLEFAYKVQDSQGNRAPTFTLVSDSNIFADAKGRVRLVPADAPSDPDYVQQWYLGVSGVPAVWDDYTGKGVKVLVLEPSGEFAIDRQAANLYHPDLIANKSIGFSDTRDYSSHATAVAGVIAAARNGVGGVGVAYDTEIDSIGLQPGTSVSRAAYRDDMNAMQRYDIVNNSWMHDNPWGHISFSDDTAFQHSLEMTAIQQAATRGRGGLGTVMVFGAGNDRSKAFDAGLSTLTANPYTITVGAINRVGDIGSGLGNNKPFSNRGANILVSAPGSNIFSSSLQIENANGSVFGSDAEEFQGTSFATPIVSGVAALMLEANPLLTYRDVQTILALTARKDFGTGVQTDSVWYRNSNAEWNGYGMHYSHDYGFGMVDARAAVRMAESWLSENGPGTPLLTHVSNASAAVPDNGKRILSFEVADEIDVEHVVVNLQLDHPRWSDLVVTLISPTGTRSTLLDRAGVTGQGVHLTNPLNELHLNKDLMSVHFRGEESVGIWHLEIEDKVTGMAGSGSILASLDVFGSNAGNARRYVLTDEYSGGWNIIGAPVFQNELNAAAVSGNLRIDLSGTSASNIGGKSLIVSGGIARLLGGDGHDTLLGAAGDEAIHGARGNDTIDGGAGNDSLYGGDGHDSLSGGSGHDSLSGGDGNDTLFGGSGQDVLTTDSGLDFLWGGADADIFLIDGDIGGTAYIKDFMVGTGGDSLQIRTPNKLNWGGIVQTIVGTNLHVTYNTTGGQRTVVLEGVGTALDARQLRTLASDEEVSIDPVTGGFAGSRVVYIKPQWSLLEVLPERVGARYVDTLSQFHEGFFPADDSGYVIVHASERSASVAPGQRIAIVSGPVIKEDPSNPNSRIGFGQYLLLSNNELSASWSGVDNTGNGLRHLARHIYSNGGELSYRIDDMHWETGSEESETLVAGLIPDQPRLVSEGEWYRALNSLGPRIYAGKGGDDELFGDATSEIMNGGSGFDTLTGGGGNDTLSGGIDADTFVFSVGSGRDQITDIEAIDTLRFEGTSPNDVPRKIRFISDDKNSLSADVTLSYGLEDVVTFRTGPISPQEIALNNVTLYRTAFDSSSDAFLLDGQSITMDADVVVTERYASSHINTLAGDDLVFALNKSELAVDTGDGNDTVYILEGGNTVDGGTGDDRIEVTSATVSASADTLIGGAGDDTLKGGDHAALLYGDDLAGVSAGKDRLTGGAADDTIYGGGGDDFLFGLEGNDLGYGGSGADSLLGGAGSDALYGEEGNDIISGNTGDDSLFGGAGSDVLDGGEANDYLDGGEGTDVLSGGMGNDTIYGGSGNDMLFGGENDDVLIGGAGEDLFETGSGVDIIELGLDSGHDTASLLTGTDTVLIHGISGAALRLELLDNGSRVKLLWGQDNINSLTLTDYSFGTTFRFDDNSTTTLRQIFERNGYRPNDSFDYMAGYDTQLLGDITRVGTEAGGQGDDQLYGGPETASDAAYWYVVGRNGDDSLAGGFSGAILDGGIGTDTFRGSNGVVIVRDTLHGGSDKLVMPEGIVPELLRFYRIPNPLQLLTPDLYRFSDDYTYISPPLLGIEERLDSVEFSAIRDAIFWRNEWGGQEYDTLRIQSIDGKIAVDIIDYFDAGNKNNNISEIIFSTVFDSNGESIHLPLEALAGVNIRGGEYWRKDPHDRNHSVPYSIALPHILGSKYAADGDGQVTIGGESGSNFQGKVKTSAIHKYKDQWGQQITSILDEAILKHSVYSSYRSNYANRDLDFLNGRRNLLDGLNFSASSSYTITTISLPDRILGFGGNDTIAANGVYVETHYSGLGANEDSWGNYTTVSGSTGFHRYYYPTSDVMSDEVNGGAGDDTYLYARDDGNLRIISMIDEFGGADGFDVLDMSSYWRTEVTISSIHHETGSFSIKVPNGTIIVDGGKLGHYQVDQIKFADNVIVNTADLLQTTPTEFIAADSRSYRKTQLAASPDEPTTEDPFSSITGAHSSINGSPLSDIIMVPQNGIVFGHEGADAYLIDASAVNFAVVAMDAGDSVILHPSAITFQQAIDEYGFGFPFAGAQSPEYEYLGMTEAEWQESGVMPFAGVATSIHGDYWLADVNKVVLQAGKLRGRNSNGFENLSISDWQPVGEYNDDISDVLISWESASGDEIRQHNLILVAVADTWGMPFSVWNGPLNYALENEVYGTQGHDYIASTSAYYPFAVQTLLSSTGRRSIYTLGGNDTVAAYADDFFDRSNRLYVGWNDLIHGGGGDDVLDGGAGNDTLYGGAGQDLLEGGFGNDFLSGGQGSDTLIGGAGNDVYVIDQGDEIVEAGGNQAYLAPEWVEDTVEEVSSTEAATLPRSPNIPYDYKMNSYSWVVPSIEQSTVRYFKHTANFVHFPSLYLDGGVDEIRADMDIDLNDLAFANIENITLLGNSPHKATGNGANNHITGNDAGSVLEGGDGDDTYTLTGEKDTVVELTDGGHDRIYTVVDIYELSGNIEDASSLDLNLNIYGNSLNNRIEGDVGNNILSGAAGEDVLVGHSGDDIYYVDRPTDVVIEALNDGFDVVLSTSDFSLSGDVEVEELRSVARFGIRLTGNLLDNRVIGGSGDDTLNGGGGADLMYGGGGDDTYVVDAQGDFVLEYSGAGRDTVISSIDYELGDYLENLTLIGAAEVCGTGNAVDNTLIGNEAKNSLFGLSGNDTLDGGGGADTLVGGIGNDHYVVDDDGDVVREESNEGVDTVQSNVSHTLRENVENLRLTGAEEISGTGNALSNVINGNSGNNFLLGGGGFDHLYGGEGNDVLREGGSGGLVVGGGGSDVYIFSKTELLSGQFVDGSVTHNLIRGDRQDILLLIDADPSEIAVERGDFWQGWDDWYPNWETGGASNHIRIYVKNFGTKDAGAILENYFNDDGGAGENGLQGIQFADGTLWSLDDVREMLLQGGSANQPIYGFSASDTISGGSGNDYLDSLSGNDLLDGGLGNDTMLGGAGDDTYVVDSASDIVIEGVNAGSDTVRSSVTYTLSNEVEKLLLTGTAAINGCGTHLENHLVGNSAANTLYGDAAGTTGNTAPLSSLSVFARGSIALGAAPLMEVWIDGVKAQTFEVSSTTTQEYVVSAANLPAAAAHRVDVVFTNDAYDAATGQDRNLYVDRLRFNGRDYLTNTDQLVLDYGAGTGARDGMNITLSSTGVIASNAALRFSLDGSDRLDGGAGADTLVGGTGDDIYYVDNVSDAVVELSGQGFDTVRSSVSHSLASHVDNLMLTGSAVSGTGNDLANLILGNSGNNILDGGAGTDSLRGSAGADTLIGGLGNDLLDGGAGNDTYRFSRGHGQDSIWESDTTVGNQDVLSFDSSVAYDQLWFKQVGNNLEISVIGTTDKLTVSNWYVSSQWRVEQIAASDKILVDTQVQALVNAMVSMPPPPLGQTASSAAQASALQPVLASSWQ